MMLCWGGLTELAFVVWGSLVGGLQLKSHGCRENDSVLDQIVTVIVFNDCLWVKQRGPCIPIQKR